MSNDLYIRYDLTDGGQSFPTIAPPGAAWWASPAIEIHGPGGGNNVVVTGIDPTVAGHPDQHLEVKVGNRGPNDLFDVKVQVWVADFGTSNPWFGTLGGSAGTEVGIGGNAVPAGARVGNGSEATFVFPGWYPSTAIAGGGAARHVCLLANVWSPEDGAKQTTPPVAGFDILTNRHHAQRNTTLAPHADGTSAKFKMMAANTSEKGQKFTLEVIEDTGKKLALPDHRQLLGVDWFTAAQADLGKRLSLHAPAKRLTLTAPGAKGKRGMFKVALEGGEQIPVTLELGAEHDRGIGIRRFTFIQRSGEEIVGAARLLLASLPEEYIPELYLATGKR